MDLNHRPQGYEPRKLPTALPRYIYIAELAGLEPAISAVTVLRDNHLHYNSKKAPITKPFKAVLFRCEAACLTSFARKSKAR